MDAEGGLAQAGADNANVYLARHGQTPLSETDRLRGLMDPELDQTGHHQAHAICQALYATAPAAIYASPLRRAVQTARPLAAALGLDVTTDQRLIDRDYGPCTGSTKSAVSAWWGSVDAAPGAESRPAVRGRAMDSLTHIVRRHPGRTVVVVSHDAITREVLVAIDPRLGLLKALPQENGCFNLLRMRAGHWKIEAINVVPVPSARVAPRI